MKNLAGDYKCDEEIRRELDLVGIPIVKIEPTRHEVPYSLIGQLGNFKFKRAWYYWVVEGLVPLNVAKEIYNTPYGKEARAGGDCTSPEPGPDSYFVEFFDSEGRNLQDFESKNEFERLLNSSSPSLSKMAAQAFNGEPIPCYDNKVLRFVEKPEEEGTGYVDCYHIDSLNGLKVFVEALKRHNLV